MISTRTKTAAAVLSAALLLASTGAAVAGQPRRGQLVGVTELDGLATASVTELLAAKGLDTARVSHGVRPYKITYRTVDPDGRPTTASGLVVLPVSRARTLKPVAWLHGTTVYRGDVASVNAKGTDRAIAVMLASAGYAVVAPDYLGLGEGPGAHPYVDPDSAATASIDALRAGRTLTERRGVRFAERVFLTGHSQGGQSTMAVGRELQRGADHRMRLGALAPIAGPYAMSASLREALADKVNFASPYVGYLTTSWNRLHGLYSDPAEAFQKPSVEQLFDGHHTSEQVFRGLPDKVHKLLTPEFHRKLSNPSGALRRALDKADRVCDWRPAVPTTLYMASGDGDVLPFNAAHCARQLGGRVPVVDVGQVDHNTAATRALPQVLRAFDSVT
ncbi:alpha/beta hydrolase [Allokutzneria sp. A3M-2-11 16]|uniref:alpha/beta hydrolase family protein n=1 Tax=Allokutzneria sp. A3M-2-11 16 TaxID=2962043 RepID=UPI0020B6C238|nr:alpha/beta fold hydrolase [Allokutzneria sp. A3M-2-11 16]MCP3803001.1 alpha/beta hydrolase [Allokutzneria sp. A3M-2-11 16]